MSYYEAEIDYQLRLLTTDKLKELCRKRNIKVSRKKAEPIEQLV